MLTELGVAVAGEAQACCVPSALRISRVLLKRKQMSLHGNETADFGEQVKFRGTSNGTHDLQPAPEWFTLGPVFP